MLIGIRRCCLFFSALFLALTCAGCGADTGIPQQTKELVPTLTSTPIQPSALSDEEAAVFDMDAIYASFNDSAREFPEELNLANNAGLLSQHDVTGPFFIVTNQYGNAILPDVDYEAGAEAAALPEGFRLARAEDEALDGYRALIETPEKLAAVASGEKKTVFVVLENIGYELLGRYDPDFELYEQVFRVSFYGLEGNLLAWRIAYANLSGPLTLSTGDYYNDANHRNIYRGDANDVTSPWPCALDGLFWENGFMIVDSELRACSLESDVIVVPEGVTSIAMNALSDHTMREIVLPEGLESIGYAAFSGCVNLSAVNIPDSVTFIDSYAFYETPWLDERQDTFVIVGAGLLITYRGADASVAIPEGVRVVCPLAFDGGNMTHIIVPEGVLELRASPVYGAAFTSLYELQRIELPDSLARMDPGCIGCNAGDVTVVCSPGSSAEQYALENGFRVEHR
ncbi:MAG TPA: leucine-rich repeat domain-containing protein [Clostridia bacterium]|nr:leucine-rich repeat domain-containing protein [Clostridia bacterium]